MRPTDTQTEKRISEIRYSVCVVRPRPLALRCQSVSGSRLHIRWGRLVFKPPALTPRDTQLVFTGISLHRRGPTLSSDHTRSTPRSIENRPGRPRGPIREPYAAAAPLGPAARGRVRGLVPGHSLVLGLAPRHFQNVNTHFHSGISGGV